MVLSGLQDIKSVIAQIQAQRRGILQSHITCNLPSFRLRPRESKIASLFPISMGTVLISHTDLFHPLGKLLFPSSFLHQQILLYVLLFHWAANITQILAALPVPLDLDNIG